MNSYIYLTENKKIKNPLIDKNKCNILEFHGSLDTIDFERQTTNFNNLIDSFLDYKIVFNEIWYGKFHNVLKEIRTTFVVKSQCGNIYWYKYEAISPGGMQNKLYICGDEFKLTNWLAFTNQERTTILQKYNL